MWITFLGDGQTAFTCLAYSGGTWYNPFVMPEKIYEIAAER